MADPASVLAWAPTPVVAPPPPTPSDIIDVGGAASLPTTPVAANANVPGGITLHADPGDAVAASWAGKTVGVNNPYSLPDSIRSQIPAGTKYPFVINVAPLPQPATVAVVPDTASPQAAAAAAPVAAAPASAPAAKPDPMARLLAAEAAAKVSNAAPVPVQVTAQRRAAIPTVPTTSSPGLPAPTPEQQQAFAAEQAQDQKQTGIIPNAMAGVNAAIAGTAGLPVDLTTGIANLGIAGINAATSANAPLIQNPVGGSAWISHAMGLIGADPNQVAAATPEEQLVRAAAGGATSAVLPMGIGGQMARAANPIVAGVGRTLAEAPIIPTAASGALAGVGGTVATDAAQHAGVPAQYLPYIDMAAQLAAGGAGALATGGVLAGTKMAQATGARFADTFDRGAQAPLLDAAGQPLLDAQGQPVAATQRMIQREAAKLASAAGSSPDQLLAQADEEDFPQGIAGHVSAQLQAAGVPQEHADAAGAITESMWKSRARAFGGARGTAQQMYEAEGPQIVGPNGVLSNSGRTLEQSAPRALADVTKEWDAKGIDHAVHENGDTITVSKIVVPKDARGKGVGTEAMRALTAYADEVGKKIALTPDNAFGGAKGRLEQFYKDLGFRKNQGRGRDFSTRESMVRDPARTMNQPAYHGSPHIFDKFSLDKIGTGEGAQAYGHGLYFAGKKSVAEYYREALRGITIDGERFVPQNYTISKIVAEDADAPGIISRKLGEFVEKNKDNPYAHTEDAQKIIDAIKAKKFEFGRKGRLYHVDIPDDHEYLDWDKPLSEQSPQVKAALEKLGVKGAAEPAPIKDPMIASIVRQALKANDGDPRNLALIIDNDSALYNAAVAHAKRNGINLDNDSPGEYVKSQAKAYLDATKARSDQTGEVIYKELTGKHLSEYPGATKGYNPPAGFNAAAEASRELHEAGISGIRYLDQGSRTKGEGSHNHVVFDDSRINIRNFEQGGTRGSITLTTDGRPVIQLLKNADASTFIHETGHEWLERLMADAEHPQAPEHMVEDAQTVRGWLGVKAGEPIPIAGHEKFARAFEEYMMSGKSPTPALARVFAQFKDWLTQIYKTAHSLNSDINPDIRKVFDRMVSGPAAPEKGGLTMGQRLGNLGLLQLERDLKTSNKDIKQQFNQREADQNASQLARIKSLGPNEAPAAAAGHYFVNRLNQIDATEAALVAKARAVYESELANHGGAESPSDTGAAMAAHVNAAYAPAEALAEGAVQMVRAKVDAAAKAAGGERADIPGGKNARQQYSETLQEQLEAIRQEANKQRHDLYEARDPEGKLALSVAPFKAAAKEIRASVEPGVDEELSPKLSKLLDNVDALPEVAKASTLAKFRVRVNAALAEAQRGMVAGKDGAANDARLMGKLKAAIDRSEAEATERAAAGDHVKAEAGAQPQETVVGRLAQHVADGSTPSAGTAVYTPSGRRIDVKYKVVETSTLKGSHNADLSVNRNFPAELQPRDRTRAASETQVQRMAGGLQPERLGASASAMDGAPIVGPDGVVESGNARYLALRRAYQAHPDSAQAYRDFLKSQGYDTTGMKEPVLVRERQTPMTEGERIKFTQEANASSGLAMSAAERAKVDAQRMPASMFDLWRPGEVDSAANRDFVRAFVKNVAEKGEEGNFITAEGGISLEGAQRIRNALLQRAYGDSNLVSALAETGDDNIKAFGGALADVAGDFAKLREAIAKGDVDPAMDISPQLLDAAKMISQARVRKISLGDLLNQKDVFSPQIDPLTEKTLRAAYGENLTGRMSRERMAKLLTFYADEAGKQTTTSRLFEENLKPGDILARGQTRDISGQTTRAVRAPSSSGYGPSVSAVGAGGEQSAARAEREAVAEPVAAAEQAPLTENLTAEDAARFRAADAFNREYKSRFGATTPAGKAVARSYGDFKMALSDVASNFWRSGSKGAESLENLKAAFGSDEAAEKAIGDYAAYDLRAFSKKGDGLDAGKLRKWMDDHAAALNQFPRLRDRFNTLTKAQAQLEGIQAQRDALNALNPVRGQSGADTLGQFVKAGPKGGEAVDAYLKHAGNTPEARQALEDGFAYSLRASAMKDGELDPKAYAAWRARFSPALDRVPETAAKFDGLATARNAVDEAAERAAEQRKAYVNSVASHYLTKGGEPVEPQVAIKSIIASETAPADVAKILAEMKGDKDAVAGLRQGFADYLVNLVRNSAESGVSGEYQVSMAKLQRVVNDPKLMATLGKVFTQDQLETLKSVASDAQKAARSYTATGIKGSPGSAADLNATHSVDPHQDVSGVVLTEALGRGAGEVLRASSGVKSILEVGALLSRIWADRASTATRAKQQDLMAQALLHPEVFRALMTAARQPVVRPGVLTRLKGLVSNLAISGATAPAVPQFKGQQ